MHRVEPLLRRHLATRTGASTVPHRRAPHAAGDVDLLASIRDVAASAHVRGSWDSPFAFEARSKHNGQGGLLLLYRQNTIRTIPQARFRGTPLDCSPQAYSL